MFRHSLRLALLDAKDAPVGRAPPIASRPAWYCSGCPHNASTKVPAGSLALAGIGCHVMATAIYPEHNRTTTHMGGEGAIWLGQAAGPCWPSLPFAPPELSTIQPIAPWPFLLS